MKRESHFGGALFGGALFAAGIGATPAFAQDMTLSYTSAVAAALDYSIPLAVFDDFLGPGTFGPLQSTAGPASGYAIGTGTLLYASCASSTTTLGKGAIWSYFSVPGNGTGEIAWDWSGAEPGFDNYVWLWNMTVGATVALVDFNAGAPQTGTQTVDLDAGIDYRLIAVAYATDGVTGTSLVSLEYTGCPCDIDGNGMLNVDDVDAFVGAFIAGDLSVDFDGNGTLNLDDLDAFVACFVAGCG